jgi:hypothetical protein
MLNARCKLLPGPLGGRKRPVSSQERYLYFIELFGVAWMPCYLIDSPDGTLELAAF